MGRYFQQQGHSVSVLCTLFEGAWFSRLQASGLTVVRLPGLGERSPYGCLQDMQTHLAQAQYDVLIPNQDALSMALLPWLKTLNRAPIVLPVAHMDIDYALSVSAWHAEEADALIGVSRRVSHRLRSLLAENTETPVYTLFNALPPMEVFPAEKSGFCSGRLLFVGRLHHAQKGVLHLPTILSDIRNRLSIENPVLAKKLSLTLIGDGPDRQEILEKFKSLGLENNIKWLGMQPEAVVQQEMQEAWGLLFPSRFEGLPFVLLEAQRAGLPAVVFDLPGITQDCLLDGKSGFIVPQGNLDRFVEQVVALLQRSAPQRQAMGEAARQHAKQFSLEKIGRQYLDLIASSLTRPSATLSNRERVSAVKETLFQILFSHPDPETAAMAQVWALQLENGKPITRRLIEQGIRRVAIYGTAKVGRLLAWDCRCSGLGIVCFLDQNPELYGQTCVGKPILTPEKALALGIFSPLDAVLFSIEGDHADSVQHRMARWLQKHLKGSRLSCLSWKKLAFFKQNPAVEACRLLNGSVC